MNDANEEPMLSNTLQIEILAFAGCPNAENAHANIAQALAQQAQSADVTYVEVDAPDLAFQMRFLGSPSVRINGLDVELTARSRSDFGLMCRTYRDGPAVTGAPSVELIRNALDELVSHSRHPEVASQPDLI